MTRLGQNARVALLVLPGKILPLAGSILLYRTLPTRDYATFEVTFSGSVIASGLIGLGLPAVLPFELIEHGRTQILGVMRQLLNTVLIAALATAVTLDAGPWFGSARNPHVSAALALTASLLAQSFLASCLRVRERFVGSAIVEHSSWLAAIAAVAQASLVGEPLTYDLVVRRFWMNAAVLGLLAQAMLRTEARAPAARLATGALVRVGAPVMAAQLGMVASTSVTRAFFLVFGRADLSALAALSFRLAAPVVFVHQALYAALLKDLFSAHQGRRAAAVERSILLLLAASAILLSGLLAGNALTREAIFPRDANFAAVLMLSVSMTALLTSSDIVGTTIIGTKYSLARGLLMALGVGLAWIVLLLSMTGPGPDRLFQGTFICWCVFAFICAVQLPVIAGGRSLLLYGAYIAVVGPAAWLLSRTAA